jgi:hypothetical protein
MSAIKKNLIDGYHDSAIVSDKVKNRSEDPFFIAKAEEAKKSLKKIDLTPLQKNRA